MLVLACGQPADAAEQWRWPLRGAVVGAFDYRLGAALRGRSAPGDGHRRRAGTRVRAHARDGWCSRARRHVRANGERCAAGRCVATYLHLGSIAVRAGRSVGAGDRLGQVGSSGQPRLRGRTCISAPRAATAGDTSTRWRCSGTAWRPATPAAAGAPGGPRRPSPARCRARFGRATGAGPVARAVPSRCPLRPLAGRRAPRRRRACRGRCGPGRRAARAGDPAAGVRCRQRRRASSGRGRRAIASP